MYRLLFQQRTPTPLALATRAPLVFIGRSPDCQLRLLDSGVSDRHAAIERREDGYYLRDLGVSNGVRVNRELVNHHRLATGDELEIGAVKLVFEVVHPPAPRRRRVDLLLILASAVITATVAGQIALLAWIFSESRPRRLPLFPPPAVAPVFTNVVAAIPEPAKPPPAKTSPPAPAPVVLGKMLRVMRVDQATAADGVKLTVLVKAQVSERVLRREVTGISVQFFAADVPGEPQWLPIPAWENFSTKSFVVRYGGPPGKLAGFVVRTFYRGQLQDVYAQPPALAVSASHD